MDYTYKTNRFRLLMLNIVGFTPIGSTFYIGFVFTKDEKKGSYEVILGCLVAIYNREKLPYPRTILTDKEKALINIIGAIFPQTKTIVYI